MTGLLSVHCYHCIILWYQMICFWHRDLIHSITKLIFGCLVSHRLHIWLENNPKNLIVSSPCLPKSVAWCSQVIIQKYLSVKGNDDHSKNKCKIFKSNTVKQGLYETVDRIPLRSSGVFTTIKTPHKRMHVWSSILLFIWSHIIVRMTQSSQFTLNPVKQ